VSVRVTDATERDFHEFEQTDLGKDE
jgi:hypothetical protein